MDGSLVPRRTSSQLSPRDAATADALYRSYGGRLFGYFRFMLGSESRATDALAETLTAAASEAARARDLDEYAPRLFMLAHAECHKHQSAEAVGAGQHWTVVTASGNPVLPEIARRAVARLTPDVREAYILSAPHNNLTLPQMAEILGVGLDIAADLRAQAGLDFVRAVALCAQEAGYIQFGGSDLRIRAEESLERDAAEPPPPLPTLSDPEPEPATSAVDAWSPLPRQPEGPPQASAMPSFSPSSQLQSPPRTPLPPPSSLPSALPSSVALPPPSELLSPEKQTLPPPTVEPFYPASGDPTRLDQAVPAAFLGGSDYGREPEPYGDHGYDTGGYGTGSYDTYGGERGPLLRTGPLRAITGPMLLDDYSPRGRRRRRVLAWTGGGVVAAAVAVIGWQVLASGPDNTMTLTHGGLPANSVPSGPAIGGTTSTASASPSQSPPASQSAAASPTATATAGPVSGVQAPAAPTPAAAQPATAPHSAPASRAPSSAPARPPSSPAPTTTRPTTPTSPTATVSQSSAAPGG